MIGKPRHIGNQWPAACRHKDPFRGKPSCAHKHIMRPGDGSATLYQINAGVGQQGSVDSFKTVKFTVLGVDQRRPVMTINTHLPPESGSVLRLGGEGRPIHQQFFGNAASDHTGAARAAFLDHRDLGTMTGRDAGRTDTAGTGANHNQIIVIDHRRGAFAECCVTLLT